MRIVLSHTDQEVTKQPGNQAALGKYRPCQVDGPPSRKNRFARRVNQTVLIEIERQDKTRQDMTRHDMTWHDIA